MNRFIAILIPGVVFQSILIGGGYASGREIMEYAARLGGNGALVIGLSGVLFSVFMYLAFELARSTGSYDYRTWSKNLLGEWWYLFDILFIAMAIIAIAVVTSTAGTTLHIQNDISYMLATSIVVVLIFAISFFGTEWIIRYKSIGTILLYSAFIYFFVSIIGEQPNEREIKEIDPLSDDWITSGFIYAGYNFVVIPACLFAVSKLKSSKEVFYSSIFGGILAIIPMTLLYIVLVGEQGLVTESLPLLVLIKSYLSTGALTLYYVVLVWTLVETGVGLTHAITDRIDSQFIDSTKGKLSGFQRAFIAVGIALIAIFLAQVGIIGLVANYYSVMAWGFLTLFALPLIYRAPSLITWKKNP